MERFPSGVSNAFFSGTQCTKIFCSFGYNIHKQHQNNSTNLLSSNVHVKEDSGITGVGELSFGGWVRHVDFQMHLEAGLEYLVASW